jgi:polyisoprenoid-binding protein YceI
MITNVRGRFPDVEGAIKFDEENVLNSSVDATIHVATINTGSEQRDNHLRSGDFFLVEQYPTITFKSKRIERKGGDEYRIIGDLTIRGITREVALDATFEGRGISPWGAEVISFFAKTTINRKNFNLNWNVALEAGGVLVGDNIRIELNVQATKNTEQADIEAEAEAQTSATVA